jgi:hypothetical protein
MLGLDGLSAEFYKTFKEEPTLVLHKMKKEEVLQNSSHKASIALTPKPDEDTTTGKHCRPVSCDEHRCKNPQ